MTVKAFPKDAVGAELDTKVSALSTTANALGNHPAKFAALATLDQAQRELVNHYMNTGRLVAAGILSTMT